ncbi:ester cyclase [Hymenobacter bucti]|uniref:Ester cyclase n=1 Tax=Hymenobacter bucti TaxID=1844114 RepID=A0ABW4R2D5_9BACT
MLFPAPTSQPLTPAEIHAIEVFYSAWKAKQPELLDQVCTPDWQDIPLGPGQGPGPQGLGAIMGAFTTAFPDTEVVIHELFGTHERVGVRAEIRFTNPHNIPGAAAPGSPVSIALHEFHYLRDGKLTHTWHLEDGAFMSYAGFALS